MKYYIKVITGFREDQQHTIPMQEAHKAYYLFKNPEARGVFNNGVALIGKNIQEIIPDWNTTMGWYGTHKVDANDWEQLKNEGVEEKMKLLIQKAKECGDLLLEQPRLIEEKMENVIKLLPDNQTTQLISGATKMLAQKYKI
jgi:hypothetical protein